MSWQNPQKMAPLVMMLLRSRQALAAAQTRYKTHRQRLEVLQQAPPWLSALRTQETADQRMARLRPTRKTMPSSHCQMTGMI